LVLLEGKNKKEKFKDQYVGRDDGNRLVVFESQDNYVAGEYVEVLIKESSG